MSKLSASPCAKHTFSTSLVAANVSTALLALRTYVGVPAEEVSTASHGVAGSLLTLEMLLTFQRSRQRTLENPEFLPLQLPFKTGLRIPLPLGMLTKT